MAASNLARNAWPLPRSTRQVGAWIEQEFGLVYGSRSGLIALLPRCRWLRSQLRGGARSRSGPPRLRFEHVPEIADEVDQAAPTRLLLAELGEVTSDPCLFFLGLLFLDHLVDQVDWGL
jgi:hypothetical protein